MTEIIDRAGGRVKLAEAAGVARPTVYEWRRVPPQHCMAVARLIGCQLYELRPDVYPGADAP